jgi:hypothetical protein
MRILEKHDQERCHLIVLFRCLQKVFPDLLKLSLFAALALIVIGPRN